MSKSIKLDPAKLLGFKVAASATAKMGEKPTKQATAPSAKLGNKEILPGAKLGQKDL